MELLPVKCPNLGSSPDSSHEILRKIPYTLQTKNLSYKLPPEAGGFWEQWFGPTPSTAGSFILKNINCQAKPGEILAIAGPSGAGKSTLLEILAGKIPPSRISGSILVNRQPMDVNHFRRVSGYVTQDDTLFPLLTVEETFMYSARLRLSGAGKSATGYWRVRELLKELGLEQVAGSRIGDENIRGISGGEKRRVSIGVDVVHDPAVLLLDEPTSGLDSASALQVISLLKSMAEKQGRTIVLSIHQPGFRILELVDQVLLLAGGSVIHNGSMKLLKTRLKTAGHCIPRHVNILEFAIDVMENLAVKTQLPTLNDLFLLSDQYGNDQEQPGEEIQEMGVNQNQISEFFYANSPLQEVLILSQRFCKNIIRTKQLFTARTVQAVVAGFGLGTIFMNVNNGETRSELQERVGFFAFSLTFLLSSTTEGLPIFLQERRILMKETSRGAYRVSSYVAANALVFIPFLLMVALLYSTPVYWLVGLRREISGFLYFSLVVWMVVLMANSFVACFSALVPNFIMGNSLIAGFMGSFFLFSGYFISKNSIPKYWVFMHYLSLFKYPFEAFLINEYGGGLGKCVEEENGSCVMDGDGFLVQQGLSESQKWSNLGVMAAFIVGYRLLCLVILWYRCSRTRK